MKSPLRTEVIGNVLTVQIGIDTLAWSASSKNGGPLTKCRVDRRRKREFARDVARQMLKEDEVGEAPLHRFFDSMIQAAADAGSGALVWKKGGI